MPLRDVLLGDMVVSRDRDDRGALADAVRAALADLAARHADAFRAPPVLTRGLDEFSAVLTAPDRAFDVVARLNLVLWPVRFRAVLVRGAIDVDPDGHDAAAMDGPAFHLAAATIDAMKTDGRLFAVTGEGLAPSACALATALGSAHQTMIAGLKPRTAETLRRLTDHAPDATPPTQDEIARTMGLSSRQAVSDALRRADHATLERMQDALRTWLTDLPEI